jgi:group I intron endonuclease
MKGGVYAIRHVLSGKLYVGSSRNLARRWREHRRALNKGTHHSRHLQRAWDRHGADAFVFEILQAIENDADLMMAEQFHINKTEAYRRSHGYNISLTADPLRGLHRSAEHRARIGASLRGRKHTAESKENMAAGRRGKRNSPEAIAKMLATKSKLPPEVLAKGGKKTRGRPVSIETRSKLSRAIKGRKLGSMPDGQRAKIAASMKARWQQKKEAGRVL